MNKYTPLLFFITFLYNCSSGSKTETTTEKSTASYSDGNLLLTNTNSTSADGIRIKNFTADTAVNKKEEGISVQFNVELDKKLIDQLHTDGFDALIIDISCKGNEGKSFSYLETYLPKLSGMIVYPDKHVVFSNESRRSLKIEIPFRKLELSPGIKPVDISLLVYPISFDKDSSRIETKHINRIATKALITQNYTATILAPALQLNTITVNSIKINTTQKAAGSYDFALGGTGFPDPYWQLWCGEELLYYSPFEKNTLTTKKSATSRSFYTCEKDVLSLRFLDYDKGPFNTDDLIEETKGTILELSNMKKVNGQTISYSIEVKPAE
jgi:hypothetical protein